MRKYIYKINRRILTDEEKRQRAEVYNEWNPDDPIDVDEFVSNEIYDDVVIFECIKCHRKDSYDFDDVKEFFDKDENLIPFCKCPFCKNGIMIPDDIKEKY